MKRGKLVWISTMILMVVAVPVFSGCTSTSGESKKEQNSKNDGKIVITELVPDVPEKMYIEKLIPDFEAKHPNISIKIAKAPSNDFDTKLQSMIAGGMAPDVTSHWGNAGFAELLDKGLITDMTDMLKADSFKGTDYGMSDNLMDIYKVDGKTYGIPVYSYVTLMLYNKDLFDKSGVPYPPSSYEDKSWTFEKMMEVAKKLSVSSDDVNKVQYGVDWNFGGSQRDMKLSYFGAKIYADDTWKNGGHATASYFDSSDVIKASQTYNDMVYKDKVSPSMEFTKAVAGQGGDAFATGKVGMYVGGAWKLTGINKYKFKVGVAAVPAVNGSNIRNVLYVDPLMIMKDSKHPKEALEWIKYQLRKDVQEKTIELSGGTPPTNQQAIEKYYNLYSPNIDPKDMKNIVEGGLKYGTEAYNHLVTSYSEIANAVKNEMDPLDNGKKTAEQVAPEIQKKVNAILNEKNAKFKK
ncbi:sugar ABC transporter substrate-binding protein [Paenibacillus marchantiophytorum]|uniref:Sugar ABC transporter substrate-binding protein n=1 Tax=Paenibacillus marchantiophytorum TaxID=1619310 RepID=A0ABQ1ENF0_9BACL|nr:extracellular solute-binding protein [Paenibacillus marchantiophytorum]GFZ78810.1 sugar ABC transporter substrate-binding protein [Paenibacillus marchantiophytorum]